MSDPDDSRIGTTEARSEGFYWVVLGQSPPEVACWARGEWWLTGDTTPRSPATVIPVSGRLVFKPRLVPVA